MPLSGYALCGAMSRGPYVRRTFECHHLLKTECVVDCDGAEGTSGKLGELGATNDAPHWEMERIGKMLLSML